MAFVTANGIEMHYRVEGRTGAQRLVFLNSLGSDLRIWVEVVEKLRDRFEILLVDKRGHGLSEATPAPYSIPLLADDLTALLDALGWARVSIVGLSIGGLIAQHVAIHAPKRVESLVLMDTAARIGDAPAWNERIATVTDAGVAAIGEAVAARWFSDGFAAAHPARFAAWRAMLEGTPREGYAGACAAVRDADYRADAARIAAPVLAIAGDADKATPPDLVKATADLIPGARFALVAGAGHLPCLERPAEVAELITGHLLQSGETTSLFDAGMAVRLEVLGSAHVERATQAITPFDAPFQRFITEGAWGSVWSRPHFTRRERSIVTIALLAALGQDGELGLHMRATANTGASAEDIAEALMHVAVYAGVPAANHAIKIAKTILAEREDTVR
ncbi:3-oxoadipate enol-lactonase [Aureimonas phyllosphaerae]|uniref:3-oxoadipate enol-lactonase/4-carboxymuconolactone decarboxylase n=1 Tax=Aureimonas phyllosphaerae TaxID=1166078 RepID=A0A7W6C1K1_9HYPH|nr:3-oxoadipate enol-lactonase [Aureimonas phyllosphaerae]MBB3937766.1 3-oxoadipate enol-lactonase/4-carboxymuconolactone decarboxylase [Aureimonas phyllosphaerae]MBB3961699.1 3-oxoadipate enol-lactonase/4-carboxymuconolactone decarboxylase [Aureimonas phyllosphaerae]SFF45770.1 4-carboxymuconolactone decarboxylase /3-oxoadipate enol-lactonase [Aureimonas phyllosphaerae]